MLVDQHLVRGEVAVDQSGVGPAGHRPVRLSLRHPLLDQGSQGGDPITLLGQHGSQVIDLDRREL